MKNKRFMIIFLLSVPSLIIIGVLFMQQKAFGQQPKEERLQKVQLSLNYKNGKFQNLEETPVMSEEGMTYKFLFEIFKRHKNTKPVTPVPSVKVDLKRLVGDSTEIVWFGHSSYLIRINRINVLVDPIFSKKASPVSFAGVTSFEGSLPYTAADMPDIDIMVITHDHYDHMDYKTIMALKDRVKKFVCPLGVGQHLDKWGIARNKIIELDWWEGKELFPGINLIATPARHFSGRGLVRNKTLWASFVLKTDSLQIFIGGDSGYGKHFKAIGEKFGTFDIAMLECGQYNKFWPNIHSMPEETALAAKDINAKVLMPVHWGKFKLAMHPWYEPVMRVEAKAAELHIPIVTPVIGKPMILGNTVDQPLWVNELLKSPNNVTLN
jgi:L-ascorbate metabolism protein UlaG (beta-lactamase superfamily)